MVCTMRIPSKGREDQALFLSKMYIPSGEGQVPLLP